MTDSVCERIMQQIQTTLEGITVAAGYANTMISVQRFSQGGQVLAETPMCVLMQGGDDVELQGPLGGGFDLVSRNLTVSVVLIHRHDQEMDPRSSAAVMNSLIQDVQKAMQVDDRRGGLAITTEEVGVGELDAEEGQPELVQTVGYRIRYRHRRTDPTIEG